MSEADRCPPIFALERHLSQEIAKSSSEPWASHIEGCPKCQARLEEMRSEQEVLGAKVKAAIDRVEPPRVLPLRRIAIVVLAAAALLLFFLVLPPRQEQDFGIKGRGILGVMVAQDEQVSAWDGSPLPTGTKIQLTWTAEAPGHLLVRSGGTVLFPETRVNAGRDLPLGESIVVDRSLDGAVISAFFSIDRIEPSQLPSSELTLRVR